MDMQLISLLVAVFSHLIVYLLSFVGLLIRALQYLVGFFMSSAAFLHAGFRSRMVPKKDRTFLVSMDIPMGQASTRHN